MPVVVCAVIVGNEKDHPGGLCRRLIIEQEQLDQVSTLGENAEVDAIWTDSRPKRCAGTGCNQAIAHLQHGHGPLTRLSRSRAYVAPSFVRAASFESCFGRLRADRADGDRTRRTSVPNTRRGSWPCRLLPRRGRTG